MTLYGTRRALLRPRRRFVDTFDALLSRWQTVAGTLAVDGGALKASALADWGPNLVANGEFTTDTTGWVPTFFSEPERVDSAVDPGAASGGADAWAIKCVKSTVHDFAYVAQGINVVTGGSYRGSARVYSPSSDGTEFAAALYLHSIGHWAAAKSARVTAEDTWSTRSVTNVAAEAACVVWLYLYGNVLGDVGYWDAVSVQRQNAAAIMRFSPHFRARLVHVSPAAAVTPAGWMFRYTDALNYWELRLLPNTDGNDMQIVQVTAGAETVRAEADVGWTAEGTDEVELIVRGSTITTRYKKSGGVWTAGPSYASATQGAQARAMGPMLYGTTTARWARAEVDW